MHARLLTQFGTLIVAAVLAGSAVAAADEKAPAPAATAAETTTPAPAAPAEWPCVSRKVIEIAPAQIWDGPEVDKSGKWRNDDRVRELSGKLISRRFSEADTEADIKKFAEATPEAERDAKLLELFSGVLDRSNEDRKIVMGGIERFHKRQLARAKMIEEKGLKLDAAKAGSSEPESMQKERTPEEIAQEWEVRIFQERQQNIPIACEIPLLIEERAGAIARSIRALMKS